MSTPLQSPDNTASTDTTHRADRWWEVPAAATALPDAPTCTPTPPP